MTSLFNLILKPTVTDLLEKQSDLIEYLRDHCNRLNQKLQQMSNQLRTVTISSPHPAI